MLEIKEVFNNGIAFEEGFEACDKILSFDGHEAIDVLDYLYYDSQNEFTVEVLAKGGDRKSVV